MIEFDKAYKENNLESQRITSDKLFIPGDLYYTYKTSRSTPKEFINKAEQHTYSGKDEYVVEHTSFEYFHSLVFSDYWWLNHMPNKYHSAMKKAESSLSAINL